MLCALKHFRFVFPVLLLAVLIILFVVVERRTEETLRALEDVLHDPAPQMAYELQNAAWVFQTEAERLEGDFTTPERSAGLNESLNALMARVDALTVFFASSPEERDEHRDAVRQFALLPDFIGAFQTQLDDKAALESVRVDSLRLQASRINRLICEFNDALRLTHQKILDGLYAKNDAERQRRNALSVLIFLNGLLLFGFLFCNARCHQRNVKQIETAEHYSALFAATLQSTRVGVMIRNMQLSDQPVVYINNAFLNMTGYDLAVMGSKKSDSLLGRHTDTAVAAAFRKAVQQGESGSFDLLIYRKDGSSFWSEWHINPLKDAKGNLTHYVSLLTDITGMRQTHEALLLAKEQADHASAVKTNFLATMSHEIRTPLNGLMGVLDLLGDTSLQHEQRKLLDLAATSSRALHEIINDILDYAKMEAGKVSIVDAPFVLRDVLRDVIDLTRPMANSKKLDLSCEIQEGLAGHYSGDAGRIRQIVLNLLTNAVKFTDRGHVKLRVQKLLTQESGSKECHLLRFEVQDTGIGISAADQHKLFKEFSQIEPSTTRRFSGTGLGLAITKRLVKMLCGEIGVESKPGQGSRFWFILPLEVETFDVAAEARRHEKPEQHLTGAEKKKHRLLLVEDNETNCLLASRYLDKAGYKHDLALTGAEAVAMAKSHNYSLVLMDISMPEMDGYEATRLLRAQGGCLAHVPVIALTAHAMQGDREHCLAAGMNDHLGKPFNYDMLVKKLEFWLAHPPSSGHDEAGGETPEPSLPDFDPHVLRHLVDDLGASSMLKITQAFLDSFGPRMDVLTIKNNNMDLAAIRETAHTLKSSSANCGMLRFSALMADIETAAARGDEPRVLAHMNGLGAVYEAARQHLDRERARVQRENL